jgi:hypothetical protein
MQTTRLAPCTPRGLADLNIIAMVYRCIALLLKMGLEGLRRRQQYFVESASAPMSQGHLRTFLPLYLYTALPGR